MLTFDWPLAFCALPLPWLCYRLLPAAPRRQAALRVPGLARFEHAASRRIAGVGGRWRGWLLALIWLLLVTAAARPVWVGAIEQSPSTGRDLMLAVDLSRSMTIRDMVIDHRPVSRLAAVKAVVGEFVRHRRGDRIGLILFGTHAYTHVPLTYDTATVQRLLDEARPGFAGDKTAIGDAIGLAVKRLKDRPANSRVLILLTDGTNTAGALSPEQAARIAAKAHLTIYTIGVGSRGMVLPGPFGMMFNQSGGPDNDTLRSIARLTGGRYFRAGSTTQLSQIYRLLDRLEPTAGAKRTLRPRSDWAWVPLAAAVVLAALWATVALFGGYRPEAAWKR